MTRDWDLIRALLLKLEQKPDSQGFIHPNALPAWDEETVSYHIRLLAQAGLIEATCKESTQAKVFCLAINLTWDDHERRLHPLLSPLYEVVVLQISSA